MSSTTHGEVVSQNRTNVGGTFKKLVCQHRASKGWPTNRTHPVERASGGNQARALRRLVERPGILLQPTAPPAIVVLCNALSLFCAGRDRRQYLRCRWTCGMGQEESTRPVKNRPDARTHHTVVGLHLVVALPRRPPGGPSPG
jgi:hypothetical protein